MLIFWTIYWYCSVTLKVLVSLWLLVADFSCKKPTWGLPSSGQVGALLTDGHGDSEVGLVEVRPAGREQLTQTCFFWGEQTYQEN